MILGDDIMAVSVGPVEGNAQVSTPLGDQIAGTMRVVPSVAISWARGFLLLAFRSSGSGLALGTWLFRAVVAGSGVALLCSGSRALAL